MRILVTPTFERTVKKLHPQQKSTLDEAVRTIASQPEIGEIKVGDLAGVQVYKFRMENLLCLLAYRILNESTPSPTAHNHKKSTPARRLLSPDPCSSTPTNSCSCSYPSAWPVSGTPQRYCVSTVFSPSCDTMKSSIALPKQRYAIRATVLAAARTVMSYR